MDESIRERRNLSGKSRPAAQPQSRLPPPSNDERAFWRRAVRIERDRQNSGRPAPFPFQDY